MGYVYTKQIIRYILIFFAVTFTSASMESGYYFLIPFLEGIGAQVGTLGGLVMGACYGVSLLLRPLVPFFERLAGKEAVIRTGFCAFFVSACGIALFARTPEGVIICRAIAGIGMGVVTIILQSYEYQLLPAEVRGRCVSLITVAYSLPALIVVPPMEFLIRNGHYNLYAATFPFIAAAGLFAVMKLPKTKRGAPQKSAPKEKVSYLWLVRSPQVLFFAASAALFAVSDAAQLRFVQLAGERGLAASYFFSVSAGTAMIFRLSCGKLVDKLPRKVCAPASTLLTAGMMFAASFASTPRAFMLCGFIFGLGMGFGYPAFMCLTLDIGGRRSAVTTLAVVFGFIYSLQSFLCPLITQQAINLTGSVTWAYRLMFGTVAALAGVCVYFSPKVYKDL
ncbi:MFS transporter [uncultured Cloacibacillus sp.]|uniref:MFS transporter n=1 Tax=uncultured Cloacibacillus sp. TaxID=889794 RepID=UPI0025D08CE2|nr:MFS transporter [uncultured Cloacibacillus sp.]